MSAPKPTPEPALELSEVKLFLRIDHHDHDFHIACLAECAAKRVEGETGLALTPTSPAPLRLAALMLTLRAYEGDGKEMPIAPVEAWIAPYRTAAAREATGADQ